MKILPLITIVCIVCSTISNHASANSQANPIKQNLSENQSENQSGRFVLEQSPNIGQMKIAKTSELCSVASNTLDYLMLVDDKDAIHPGSVVSEQISLKDVALTLAFICETYRQDVQNKNSGRMHDSEFLKANFDFYRWYPDKNYADKIREKSTNDVKNRLLKNIPADKLFITKYYTKKLKASNVKTELYNQALYALPYDEQGMSKIEAENHKSTLTRFKYTRAQIIAGALEDNKLAKPLIWITEDGLHDVLLQGTGVLEVDGKTRYFNVHRNNGISYDYAIGKNQQGRYWYFAEVPSIMGYGNSMETKIAIKAHATFAGNIKQLGLGKLVMINYPQGQQSISELGVLADTGGAFNGNLFQLDFLVDSYYGWSDYHQANKHLPDYANTWILIKKKSAN